MMKSNERFELTSRTTYPCRGCARRCVGCRASCAEWAAAAQAEAERKELERKNRKAYYDYPMYLAIRPRMQ